MGWAFVFMFVFLKLPVFAALGLLWWALRTEEAPAGEPTTEGGGGSGSPRPRRPRPPRRGPHASPPPGSPKRIRARARSLTGARAR